MAKELNIKKCNSCGAITKIINDCNCEDCGILCCDKIMDTLVSNTSEAASEKHLPEIEVNGEKIKVTVNHVMEEEHYIEWISLVTETQEIIHYFNPGEVAEVEFDYIPGSKVYSFCNKHDLWMNEVK